MKARPRGVQYRLTRFFSTELGGASFREVKLFARQRPAQIASDSGQPGSAGLLSIFGGRRSHLSATGMGAEHATEGMRDVQLEEPINYYLAEDGRPYPLL